MPRNDFGRGPFQTARCHGAAMISTACSRLAHASKFQFLRCAQKPASLFLQEFLYHPLQVGSVCPSSRYLTAALGNSALSGQDQAGLIIDMGTGTGCVSRQLLRMGIPPEQILAVEISRKFEQTFRQRCKNIQLHIGDGGAIGQLLERDFNSLPVCAIISSLPLLSLPRQMVERILSAWRSLLLERGGVLVQYTYALWNQCALRRFGFCRQSSSLVFRNIPPALVEVYRPMPWSGQ